MKCAVAFIAFLAALGASAAGAVTILVGPAEEHSTIQSAIDDASAGDVVQVLAGVYVENVALKGGVDVIGEAAETAIIRSLSESFPTATVEGEDNVTLRGFTISGGYYGVRCVAASPTITDCVIWRNASCGILLEGSSPTISRSVIAQNPRHGMRCVASSAPAISNCTFSANGYGVFSSDSAPALTNCILWGNWDDFEGITAPGQVRFCDVQDGDFLGSNGNISEEPAFVAWGRFNDSDNQVYVDVGHLGPEEGTRENPFTRVGSAVSLYSYHLALGSPCLGAGEGGLHMGAYPAEHSSEARGSDRVIVNVAPGTYQESRLFVCHRARVRGSESSPAAIVGFGDTVFFVLGTSSVENFLINGGSDAINCSLSEASVSNCVISLCGQNGVRSFYSRPVITGCHISDNWESGISLEGGSAVISDCLIGSHSSLGISCVSGCSATVRNCVLTGSPVGLSCTEGSNAEIGNCTVTKNGWKGIESKAGASVTVVNSIVWDNPFGELSEDGGSIQATFSDVGGGFPGEGNINADPLFEAGPLGSFYLDSDSLCVNKGNDTAENLALDTRTTFTTSERDSGIVDMGYHYDVFEIKRATLREGRISLEWVSAPGRHYTVFRTSSFSSVTPWEVLGEGIASWTRQIYTLDLPSGSAEFYRVGQP